MAPAPAGLEQRTNHGEKGPCKLAGAHDDHGHSGAGASNSTPEMLDLRVGGPGREALELPEDMECHLHPGEHTGPPNGVAAGVNAAPGRQDRP